MGLANMEHHKVLLFWVVQVRRRFILLVGATDRVVK